MDDDLLARLTAVYRDLHRHPELSSQEHRTAGIVAAWLRDQLPQIEIEVHHGGQPLYPYLFGVE